MSALVTTSDLVHVFKSRTASHVALDHVTLQIQQGTSLGVVGESGSGKTTLVRCMLGLLRPTSGSVSFDGAEVSRMSTRELRAMRRRVGMVFQNPVMALMSGTTGIPAARSTTRRSISPTRESFSACIES